MKPNQERDVAFLQLDRGSCALGWGPFETGAEPIPGKPAFYVNDFALSDPNPWKIPSRVEIGASNPFHEGKMDWDWELPEENLFAEFFQEWKDAFDRGVLQKAVPAVTARALWDGSSDPLFKTASDSVDSRIWSYGGRIGESGFCGLTPERLFVVRPGELITAALAGTTRPGRESEFSQDPKQVREHELVVEDLSEKLRLLGEVERSPREILRLNGLAHFISRIRVALYKPFNINSVMDIIHPTPAVGTLPRQRDFFQALLNQRHRAGVPRFFGAPFGFWDGAVFESVVMIRGVMWEGSNIYLPQGCGVVRESTLEDEWQELNLKRQVVAQAMELPLQETTSSPK